jgi:outer membrane protein assembly factor BamA
VKSISLTNISLIVLLASTLSSCISTKRVKEGDFLLEKNIIYINENRDFTTENSKYLRQQPNNRLLGFYPFFLHFYNFADYDPEENIEVLKDNNPKTVNFMNKVFSEKSVNNLKEDYIDLQNWIKETGEEPVILDAKKTEFSRKQLSQLFKNQGYFLADVSDTTDYKYKKSKVKYYVKTGPAYYIDSINHEVDTEFLVDIYLNNLNKSYLVSGDQFNQDNFYKEQERITKLFRNNGVYNFQRKYISYIADTNRGNQIVDIKVLISNYPTQTTYGIDYKPHKQYYINKVNFYTDFDYSDTDARINDSVKSGGYYFLAKDKNRFKPRAITDATFFEKDKLYREDDHKETIKLLSRLGMFKITDINIVEDSLDTERNGLISNIYLSPLKRNTTKIELEGTNSNTLGLGLASNLSFTNRNTFGGAEILDVSLNLMVGNQKDASINNDAIFNAYQYGMNLSLKFPRFLLPWNTENMVPKRMRPRTIIKGSFNNQLNIGLSNNSYNTELEYIWNESESKVHAFKLYNFQYIKYLNSRSDYFKANPSEESVINDAQDQFLTDNPQYEHLRDSDELLFIMVEDDSFKGSYPEYLTFANSVQRYGRLTQDYLISSINYSFTYNNQLESKERSFLYFKFKAELAGSLFSLIDKIDPLDEVQTGPDFNSKTVFNLPYAQFAKFDLDFRKYWRLNDKDKIAFRSLFGITIPFGNSQEIPFERSYFSGGVSDVRAWKPYDIGPGSVQDFPYDYSYDKMKITLGLEYRLQVYGKFHTALFVDAGNIWGLGDDISKANFKFSRFYKEFAVGVGYGLRYDFNFFVFRFDFGYKAIDPRRPEGSRWMLNEENFWRPQVNFAIGYPF